MDRDTLGRLDDRNPVYDGREFSGTRLVVSAVVGAVLGLALVAALGAVMGVSAAFATAIVVALAFVVGYSGWRRRRNERLTGDLEVPRSDGRVGCG